MRRPQGKAERPYTTALAAWRDADCLHRHGFNEDLKQATERAVRNMITFLSEQNIDHPLLTRADAYALISVACDVDITQLVDSKSGVHVLRPKALFTK